MTNRSTSPLRCARTVNLPEKIKSAPGRYKTACVQFNRSRTKKAISTASTSTLPAINFETLQSLSSNTTRHREFFGHRKVRSYQKFVLRHRVDTPLVHQLQNSDSELQVAGDYQTALQRTKLKHAVATGRDSLRSKENMKQSSSACLLDMYYKRMTNTPSLTTSE